MVDIRDFDPSRCGGDRRKAQRRGPALTPDGQILVGLPLTDAQVVTITDFVVIDGSIVFGDPDGFIDLAPLLVAAREFAVAQALGSGLTSGQRQGYIDNGRIEPPLDEEIDRKTEAKLDEVYGASLPGRTKLGLPAGLMREGQFSD